MPKKSQKKKAARKPRKISVRDDDQFVSCRICGERFTKISEVHAQTHGMTLDQYQHMFGITTPEEEQAAFVDSNIIDAATALTHDTSLKSMLSSQVRGYIFSNEQRNDLSAILSYIYAKFLNEAESLASSKALLLKEIFAPWRITSGGDNGGPTATKDLLAMLKAILTIENRPVELMTNMAKISSRERSSDRPIAVINAHQREFTGETIDAMFEVSNGEREEAREALFLLAQHGDPDAIAKILLENGTISDEEFSQRVSSSVRDSKVIDVDSSVS